MTKHIDPSDECSFNVEVKSGHPKNVLGATYPRFLEVMIYGMVIHLDQHGRAYIGGSSGKPISLPSNNKLHPGLRIYKYRNYVIIDTECGIRVGFDGEGLRSVAVIDVPPRYKNQMVGLCGDCDGKLDDLRTAEGVRVDHRADKYELIANSFKVDEFSDKSLPGQNQS